MQPRIIHSDTVLQGSAIHEHGLVCKGRLLLLYEGNSPTLHHRLFQLYLYGAHASVYIL